MLFGVLAAPMPWKSFLIVAPMWAFLSTAGATYLYMARFSAALSAGLPWRCPICDSQVPRGTRRGHMIQAHGPEAGLPWILRRLAGVWLLIALGGLSLVLSLYFFDLISETPTTDSTLTLTVLLALLLPFMVIGEVSWRRRLNRLRAVWMAGRGTDLSD